MSTLLSCNSAYLVQRKEAIQPTFSTLLSSNSAYLIKLSLQLRPLCKFIIINSANLVKLSLQFSLNASIDIHHFATSGLQNKHVLK